jgi:hypothetical protein
MKGRKSDKARRTIPVRFSTDPALAKQQRNVIDRGYKIAGYTNRNEWIVDTLMDAARSFRKRKA